MAAIYLCCFESKKGAIAAATWFERCFAVYKSQGAATPASIVIQFRKLLLLRLQAFGLRASGRTTRLPDIFRQVPPKCCKRSQTAHRQDEQRRRQTQIPGGSLYKYSASVSRSARYAASSAPALKYAAFRYSAVPFSKNDRPKSLST